LQSIISERGIHHIPLNETLKTLQQRIDILRDTHEDQGIDLAGIIWRLYCSLSRLQTTST